LAYNFKNDPFSPSGQAGGGGVLSPGPTPEATTTAAPSAMSPGPADAAAVPAEAPESAAFARFRSCRWQQPKEEGSTEFCTHREVKPYAGTNGFDADAWCTDCQYYKLRRAPKKRQPSDDYTY
jgi:hypothetical protein